MEILDLLSCFPFVNMVSWPKFRHSGCQRWLKDWYFTLTLYFISRQRARIQDWHHSLAVLFWLIIFKTTLFAVVLSKLFLVSCTNAGQNKPSAISWKMTIYSIDSFHVSSGVLMLLRSLLLLQRQQQGLSEWWNFGRGDLKLFFGVNTRKMMLPE